MRNTDLHTSFIEALLPAVEAINNMPTIIQTDAHGKDLPSTQDKGLDFFLGNLINQTKNAIEGFKKKDGSIVSGAKAYLDRSSDILDTMMDQVTEGELSANDRRFIAAEYYYEANKAKYECYVDILSSLEACYQSTFNKKWQPYVATVRVGTAVTAEDRAKKLELLKEAEKKSAARTETKGRRTNGVDGLEGNARRVG